LKVKSEEGRSLGHMAWRERLSELESENLMSGILRLHVGSE